VLIVGFALVLATAVATVVDVSAAYLQRQSLDTVADGAALRAADVGATGQEVYAGGVPSGRLDLSVERIRGSVREFLVGSGAYASFPGLSFDVDLDAATSTVTVHVTAPLDLPLTVPGSPGVATIGAQGSAIVIAAQ
jgi:hypothetical protein